MDSIACKTWLAFILPWMHLLSKEDVLIGTRGHTESITGGHFGIVLVLVEWLVFGGGDGVEIPRYTQGSVAVVAIFGRCPYV